MNKAYFIVFDNISGKINLTQDIQKLQANYKSYEQIIQTINHDESTNLLFFHKNFNNLTYVK